MHLNATKTELGKVGEHLDKTRKMLAINVADMTNKKSELEAANAELQIKN